MLSSRGSPQPRDWTQVCGIAGDSLPPELVVKNPPAMQETHERGFDPWVGKIPWSRKWKLAPVFLPGKSLGQGSLVGYSPWGHKELDTTKRQSAVGLLISAVNTSLLSGAFSSCGEPLPAAQRTARRRGGAASRPVGSSRTRGRPYVSCIGRQILKH